MSPEARNASPRLMRVAISASEYRAPAGESTEPDEALVGRLSGRLVLTRGTGADDELVSVFTAVCGGGTVDCSLLIGLLSPALTAE
jgi:hypothetical protein